MKQLLVLAPLVVAAVATVPAAAGADSFGDGMPSWCTEHHPPEGGADPADDFHCAGLSIEYHTSGVASSPFPLWAGQWLFTDEDGHYRVGYCALNRAHHPNVSAPSQPVPLPLPLDPDGRRAGYLSWAYGDTDDPLTAAAMWAVIHHFAADPAGTNRSVDGSAPLVPSLDVLSRNSGRADLQARAEALEAEASELGRPWTLVVRADATDGGADVTISLLAGDVPVAGRPVSVLVSGRDLPLVAETGPDGSATVAVPLLPGTATVVATTESPGPAVAYRGTPAVPDPHGAQVLVTAGDPVVLRAETAVDVVATTTTSPTATTVIDTTTSTTTTTVAAATTTSPPTTMPPTVPTAPLPRTGGGGGSAAYPATSLLVAGIGLMGVVRRRARREPSPGGAYTR